MTTNIRFFILTGEPGVGKTTLVKKLASFLSDKGVKTFGFYTEEVRRNGVREGFDVVTLDGKRGQLAKDQALINGPVRFKVGKYAVLIQDFENVALPSLKPTSSQTANILIIDEIGKMEIFSDSFKSKVKEIFSDTSNCVVLATIPIRRSDSLIENIRNHSKAKVWTVTRDNRNNIQEDIINQMRTVFKEYL